MNSSCVKPCLSSRSMNWTSKCIGQFVCAWPGSPHRKQMRAVMSFGRGGADALTAGGAALDVPKAWTMGGRSCEMVVGSVAIQDRGL
jgi:hypothetical protein